MKVLSWDVGIINLAYCMIEYDKDNWKILEWGIINLTNREEIKCKKCGLNASCYTDINDEVVYYCKKHLPKDIKQPEFDEIFTEDKTKLCQWESKSKCTKTCKYKTQDGKYYCSTHAKSIFKKIQDQYKVKSVKKKSVGSLSIDDLKIDLIKELENKKSFMEANIILIENQPSMKNPKMKAISSTIYDYFLIRGIFDREVTNSKIEKVKFMSPSNKLKLADEGDTKKLVKAKGDESKSYKLTKSLGIKYCKVMIEPYPQWKDLLDSHKKKDDLADSFLQGMYYFNEVVK